MLKKTNQLQIDNLTLMEDYWNQWNIVMRFCLCNRLLSNSNFCKESAYGSVKALASLAYIFAL